MQGGPHDDNQQFHADAAAQEERLSTYLDGSLDATERAALERHMASCAACQQQLAELRQVRALLRALPTPALPRSFTLPVPETAGSVAARELPPARRGLAPVARSRAQTQWQRTAQWAGSIAAVIGLILLLSGVLPAASPVAHLTSGSAGSASYSQDRRSPSTTNDQANSHTPTTMTTDQHGTQTTTPGGTLTSGSANPTATHAITPSTPSTSSSDGGQNGGSSGEPFPILPVGGATLLIGGVALFTAGRLGGRNRRRQGRAAR